MQQYRLVKKDIMIDARAAGEINSFAEETQIKLAAALDILARDGFLQAPYAKRINSDLFEVRIKHHGQWRALYAYLGKKDIIILSAFQKKTSKTPIREIIKAQKRLGQYEMGGEYEKK